MAGRRGEGQLRELARVNGIQLSYRDVLGRRRRATNEALAGALRALGIQLDRPSDARAALLAHRKEYWDTRLEPVIVACVFEELEPELTRVSLRSKSEKVNVNEIAAQFGGGGHPAAAGARIAGKPFSVQRRVIGAIKKALNNSR